MNDLMPTKVPPPAPTGGLARIRAELRLLPLRLRCAWQAFQRGNYRLMVKDVIFEGPGWRRDGKLVLGPNGSLIGTLPNDTPVLLLNGVAIMSTSRYGEMAKTEKRLALRHARSVKRRKRR